MPTTIKLKNSVTTTNVPSSLAQGEVAINVTDKKMWVGNAATTPVQLLGAGVTGDVVGPASATDNAISRFDATTGKLIQNSLVTVSDTGAISAPVDSSISGLTVGKGASAVSTNTAVGASALAANTTGSRSVAVGDNALLVNTTGERIVAIGSEAFTANTSGSYNTGVGWRAAQSNTSGAYNTAIGHTALTQNTTGANNTSLGSQALFSNTTASNNTAVGYTAGYSNTTGNVNCFFGQAAGYSNTTGVQNVVMGDNALTTNSTGSYNTAIGRQSLALNTTGAFNTAVGYQAGYSKTTSDNNTFVGRQAGYSVTTGTLNTFIGGADSGYYVTTGSKNTILGAYDGNKGGLDIRTASNYIVLSDGDGNPRITSDGSGNILLGTATSADGKLNVSYPSGGNGCKFVLTNSSAANNVIVFNNTNGTVGYIQMSGSSTSYNTSSDYRLKENIAPMTGALATVSALKPVTYTWKSDSSSGQGFIAHELQAVVPDCVTGEKDAVDAEGKPQYQGIDTSFLVATLTAAIQELKAEVDSLKQQIGK